MSEAIIARRNKDIIEIVYNYIYNDIYNTIYKGEFVILPNSGTSTFSVPTNIANNTLTVMAAGAKGSDINGTEGQYGELITASVQVNGGEAIPVYIGEEGIDGQNGGSTSFGTYLIANGGSAGSPGQITKFEEYANTNSGYILIGYKTGEDQTDE